MSPQRYIFRKQQQWYSSPLAIFVLVGMILGGLFVTQGYRRGEIKPMFLPTPTPTRIAGSFALEADTHFQAGNLDAAIQSYQDAINVDPQNGRLYAELARILTYSTESQTTDIAKQDRFELALKAANQAVVLSPDDSTAYAILGFTKDWYASFYHWIKQDNTESERLLVEADQAISKAITLDETNTLAQVFRAEIMIDQLRYDQAQSALRSALDKAPNLWDAHRVNGLFLESQGYYTQAIDEFKKAVTLAPNMTFLYIKLGMSYRNLALKANSKELYETAISYFAQAAALNEQLGIKDPQPYLGIGRAYAQEGEFYVASLNMNKALQYNPYNPDSYAQIGMVYRQARNYEDAISALHCAVKGCSAKESCDLRGCNEDVDPPITIQGMELNGLTIVYYYTYASLLAGMYLPNDPTRSTYCDDSTTLIRQIRASSFSNDPTIQSILNESESICRSMKEQALTPVFTPTLQHGSASTPRPPTRTPVPTKTPNGTPVP